MICSAAPPAADYVPPSAESSEPAVAEVASVPEGPSAPTAVSVVSDLEAAAEVLTNPPDVTALGMLLGRGRARPTRPVT